MAWKSTQNINKYERKEIDAESDEISYCFARRTSLRKNHDNVKMCSLLSLVWIGSYEKRNCFMNFVHFFIQFTNNETPEKKTENGFVFRRYHQFAHAVFIRVNLKSTAKVTEQNNFLSDERNSVTTDWHLTPCTLVSHKKSKWMHRKYDGKLFIVLSFSSSFSVLTPLGKKAVFTCKIISCQSVNECVCVFVFDFVIL